MILTETRHPLFGIMRGASSQSEPQRGDAKDGKKPATSVAVVPNGIEATAGSTLSRLSAIGIRMPPAAAAIA
jgi:hypothetical protein